MPSIKIQTRTGRVRTLHAEPIAQPDNLPLGEQWIELDDDTFKQVNAMKRDGLEVVKDGDHYRKAKAKEIDKFAEADALDNKEQMRSRTKRMIDGDCQQANVVIKWVADELGIDRDTAFARVKKIIDDE